MEKRWIRAAVCQLGAESPDPGENLDRAEALVREAARGMPDLDLILLPECVDFLARSPEEAGAGPAHPRPLYHADVPPGPGAPRQPGARKHHGADGVGQGAQYHGLIDREGEILGGTPRCTCLTP
ncbi:MAG: nitrilase-related carbon-nitrogen hydrolase [Flavonifractor plautii]